MKSDVSAIWFSAPAGPNIARRTSRPASHALPAFFQSFFQCGRGFLPEIFFVGFAAFFTALANQSSRSLLSSCLATRVRTPAGPRACLMPGIHVLFLIWQLRLDRILIARGRFDQRPDVA